MTKETHTDIYRENQRLAQAKRRAENPDKYNEISRRSKEKHKDRILQQRRDRYNLDPEGNSKKLREYRAKNKDKIKEYNRKQQLKRFYGLTPEAYKMMYDVQNGQCAICYCNLEFSGRSTHIDHDHFTGDVRGILCNMCNMGLAGFRDNTSNLAHAISYIQDRAVVS